MENPQQTSPGIPEFDTFAEEARFWDAHRDTSEFESQWQPVKVRFAKNLSENIQVRFDPETDRELSEEARRRGVKKSTLIRMIMKEWLRDRNRSAS
jgi:hypothetical protein